MNLAGTMLLYHKIISFLVVVLPYWIDGIYFKCDILVRDISKAPVTGLIAFSTYFYSSLSGLQPQCKLT